MIANLYRALRKSDDLRLPKYRGHKNVYKGHCYISSEALFFFLGGKKAGYTPHVMRVGKDTHWFLVDKQGKVYDPTYRQFKQRPDYSKGRACGFLTKQPSKRAVLLMERMKNV